MSDISTVEKLKDLIIEQVAQDVLILSDNVNKLNGELKETQAMVTLLNQSVSDNFDLAAKQITDFLVEQEKHLAEQATDRTKQITMNISDGVEKILQEKFNNYTKTVEEALTKFGQLNEEAVKSLHDNYLETQEQFKAVNESKPKKGWFSRK